MAKRKSSKIQLYAHRHRRFTRLSIFMFGFAIIGGGLLYLKSSAATVYLDTNLYGSQCITNNPANNNTSNKVVTPGQKFYFAVNMKNIRNTVWSPRFGYALIEFNNGINTNYWNSTGGSIYKDYPNGTTAPFILNVTSPQQTGVYPANWAMAVIYQGVIREPCTGRNITVSNKPTAKLWANGQEQNISIYKGSSLKLTWVSSATDPPTSCRTSGSNSGTWPNGSRMPTNYIGVDPVVSSSTGLKSFVIECTNTLGYSSTVTRTVQVIEPPANPPSNPPPNPGGGSQPAPSAPRPRPSTPGAPTSPVIANDSTPPSTPANFTGSYSQSAVDIRWDGATDDVGLAGYQLERSLDNSTWQKLGENDVIEDTIYADYNVSFQTKYYYRIRAMDQAGNPSPYATVEIETGAFEPNYATDADLELVTDDGKFTVSIPSGAMSEPALCIIAASQFLPPLIKNFESASGPHDVNCKPKSGIQILEFSKDITVRFNVDFVSQNQYTEFQFYSRGDDWAQVAEVSAENSFVLGSSTSFVAMGKIKSAPLWKKILTGLIIIVTIVGAVLFGLSRFAAWKYRSNLKQKSQDLYNKEHGY